MAERSSWGEIRARRMTERGADTAYHAAKLAYELGRTVRQLREQRGLSQTQLAAEANMTQSAVARFEAGGTVPSLPVLDRLARARPCRSHPEPASPNKDYQRAGTARLGPVQTVTRAAVRWASGLTRSRGRPSAAPMLTSHAVFSRS